MSDIHDTIICPICGEEADTGACPECEGYGLFTHDEDTPTVPFPEPIQCETCKGDGDGYYCAIGDHFTRICDVGKVLP